MGENYKPQKPVYVTASHNLDEIAAEVAKGKKVWFGDGNRTTPKSVMRGKDIAADIADINAGKATILKYGEIVAPSGRVYGIHTDGKLAVFPKSGEGVVQLNQLEFGLFQTYLRDKHAALKAWEGFTTNHNQGLRPDSLQKIKGLVNSLSITSPAPHASPQPRAPNTSHVPTSQGRIHGAAKAGVAMSAAIVVLDYRRSSMTAQNLLKAGNATAAISVMNDFYMRTGMGAAGAGVGAHAGKHLGPWGATFGAMGGALVGEIAGGWIARKMDLAKVFTQSADNGKTIYRYNPEHPKRGWELDVSAYRGGPQEPGGRYGLPLKASPELAAKLTAQSFNTAYELALANPPIPPNPFRQPANAKDPLVPDNYPKGPRKDDWLRDHGKWVRLDTNGRLAPPPYRVIADPQRTAELEAAARRTMLETAQTRSLPAIAQRMTGTMRRTPGASTPKCWRPCGRHARRQTP